MALNQRKQGEIYFATGGESMNGKDAQEEHQRLLDNDPFYQQLQDEIDQSWWQTIENGGPITNEPQNNSTEEMTWD